LIPSEAVQSKSKLGFLHFYELYQIATSFKKDTKV
jgi:hypothetical protein